VSPALSEWCALSSEAAAAPEGWPFWAPSDLAEVEHALDLAGLRAGEHLVDLGCGDGQVLVAAARRGASVEGIDTEEDLAAQAAEALEANHLFGTVSVGDVFEHPLEADVLFTYLSPGTLQRLAPRLQSLARPGTRLVTVDYHVPGLEPEIVDGRIRLYRLPAPASPPAGPDELGWPSAGLLTTVPPDVHSLTTLSFHHPGGPVAVEPTGDLEWAVTLHVGADEVDAGSEVAVDIRWEPMEEGTVVVGGIRCADHAAAVVGELLVGTVTSDEDHELWEVTGDGVRRLLARRQDKRRRKPLTSVADLVAACDDDRYDA
jgi:SAM-dependent methyltransferase